MTSLSLQGSFRRNSILAQAGIAVTLLMAITMTFAGGPNIVYAENPPVEIRMAIVTGYSSEVGQTDSTPFLTASQTLVRDGVIACPRSLPFGTRVEISGKLFTCEDRMNIRYGDYNFDIWFEETGEAWKWGKKYLEVKIFNDI